MELCPDKSTRFFQSLQSKTLDLRDKRGKKHDLSVVLTGLVMGLMSVQDGSLSAVHRHMVQHYDLLCEHLRIARKGVVSRAQLPIILSKTRVEELKDLILEHFGHDLKSEENQWFSVDGKELRGSHELGHTRGESVVEVVGHEDRRIVAQTYYSGEKESEIPAVRQLLQRTQLEKGRLTLDALHCNEQTTAQINAAGGVYLIGVKDNQKLLAQDLQQFANARRPLHDYQTFGKEHGRIEERTYQAFDIRGVYFDDKWEHNGLASFVRVERQTTELKTNKTTQQHALYVSNQALTTPQKAKELFNAVRNHWSVETNNWVRDVDMKEDFAHSRIKTLQRTMAALRTIALDAILKSKPHSSKVLMENCNRNFSLILNVLNVAHFL